MMTSDGQPGNHTFRLSSNHSVSPPFSHTVWMPDETDAKKTSTAAPLENWMRPPGRPHTTSRLSSRTWNPITSPCTKQMTCHRIVHSEDLCLHLVLRTHSACHRRTRKKTYLVSGTANCRLSEWLPQTHTFGQPYPFSLTHGYLLINHWQLLSVAFLEKKNSNRCEASDATQVVLTNWVCGRVWCCIWELRSGCGGSWVRPYDDRHPAAPGTSVPARETASSVASIHTPTTYTPHTITPSAVAVSQTITVILLSKAFADKHINSLHIMLDQFLK